MGWLIYRSGKYLPAINSVQASFTDREIQLTPQSSCDSWTIGCPEGPMGGSP